MMRFMDVLFKVTDERLWETNGLTEEVRTRRAIDCKQLAAFGLELWLNNGHEEKPYFVDDNFNFLDVQRDSVDFILGSERPDEFLKIVEVWNGGTIPVEENLKNPRGRLCDFSSLTKEASEKLSDEDFLKIKEHPERYAYALLCYGVKHEFEDLY